MVNIKKSWWIHLKFTAGSIHYSIYYQERTVLSHKYDVISGESFGLCLKQINLILVSSDFDGKYTTCRIVNWRWGGYPRLVFFCIHDKAPTSAIVCMYMNEGSGVDKWAIPFI